MASIKAFQALRFTDKAGEISELVCPPYDIISEEERKQFLSRNSHNIIRLELPKDGDDPYAEAGKTLGEWLNDGILAKDKASMYIYEEIFTVSSEVKSIKGLVCTVGLEPFSNGVVLPHEETLSKAKTDRFNLMKATNCNFSSIYSLYFDAEGTISGKIAELSPGTPDISFKTGDGITHNVWIISDERELEFISGAFEDKKLYIADGHHRYETGLAYKQYLAESGTDMSGGHPASNIMMTLVNMENEGLVVFPTHRIIRELDNFDSGKLISDCGEYFNVRDIAADGIQAALDEAVENGEKAVIMYAGKTATLLTLKDSAVMEDILPATSEAYRQLDVNVLHILILERLLGIDKENLANQKNLIYTRDLAEAISAVDDGSANCSFIINPTKVEEIASVAGAGEKMPQKSTYFYPKLITGHIINPLF